MARIGRPPLTEAVIQERIADYCARYDAAVTHTGFPAYPAGLRESAQHHEWMALFKVFSRLRAREDLKQSPGKQPLAVCPVCLEGLPRLGRPHRRCASVIDFVRELGEPGMERIRAVAFPNEAGTIGRVARGTKPKV